MAPFQKSYNTTYLAFSLKFIIYAQFGFMLFNFLHALNSIPIVVSNELRSKELSMLFRLLYRSRWFFLFFFSRSVIFCSGPNVRDRLLISKLEYIYQISQCYKTFTYWCFFQVWLLLSKKCQSDFFFRNWKSFKSVFLFTCVHWCFSNTLLAMFF